MSAKVSPQVRILALVGMLGALALGGGFMLLGRGSGSSGPPKVIKPLHPVHKHAAVPAPVPAAKAEAAPPAKAKPMAAAKPAAQRPVRASGPGKGARGNRAVPPAQAAKPALPANGLPASINRALATHEVVVVSLYDPQADVDAASLGEAQAGAKLADVGFVPLNVLSQAEAAPLAKKLGVLSDPALLVFRAPDQLVFRVNGFADRETVAQAATNAKP